MNEPIFTTYDYAIGGKLVMGKAVMDESFSAVVHNDQDAKDIVKKKLISDLATYMLENKLVEFTQVQDPMSYKTTVMVRAYLAPNDQVKILRLANKVV
jgi:hypothetical protein